MLSFKGLQANKEHSLKFYKIVLTLTLVLFLKKKANPLQVEGIREWERQKASFLLPLKDKKV